MGLSGSPTSSLLPVVLRTIGDADLVQTINARELHGFLGVGKVFGAWIQDRIVSFGFGQWTDYVTEEGLSVPNLESSKSRPQRTIEYHLSLDMAKELAMIERLSYLPTTHTACISFFRRLRVTLPACWR